MINKNIILYDNYSSKLRPSLIPDEAIKRMDMPNEQKEKMIEQKRNKLEFLVKLTNINEVKKLVEEEYKNYCQIKKDFSQMLQYSPMPFDSLFADYKPVEVFEFQFPYISFPPINNSLQELHEMYFILEKVNENFYKIQKNKDDFKNSFYSIPLMCYDINQETELFGLLKERMKVFKNIFIWIIDFNELYHTSNEIFNYCNFIDSLKSGKNKIFVQFIGIYTYQFLRNLGLAFSGIIRLSGYPGRNINIPAKTERTRRLVEPISFNFFNETGLSDALEKPAIQEQSFNCNCNVCKKFNVHTYKQALNIYLSGDPTKVPEYKKYHGRAKATLKDKIRKIQNENILKHCFFNVEQVLNLSFEDFKSMFSDTRFFEKWNEIYKKWGI